MSPLEQAIRNALERSDRANPDARARIYQSARNALESGLRKQEITDPAVIADQRERLEVTIRKIETEEAERLAAMARLEKTLIEVAPDVVGEAGAGAGSQAPEVNAPGPEVRGTAAGPDAPSIMPDERMTPPSASMPPERIIEVAHRQEDRIISELAARPDDRLSGHEEDDPAWASEVTPAAARVTSDRRSRVRRAGSLIVALFVYSVILGGLGFGGWWVWQTGLLKTLAERSGNIPEIVPEVTDEDFAPSPLDPKQSFSGDWLSIFDTAKGEITAGQAVETSRVSDSDGEGVRIASAAPDMRGEAVISIPANALQELGGKSVIFALTLKSDADQPTEIYVECDFGSLGNCGRHRYTVVQDRADQLFKLDFTNKLAPSADGKIIINSDVTGGGRAIRLYGVRALPGG